MIFEALTALVITSKVGIGVYTDTTGSPPLAVQLDAARNLTGADGWVVLYLCSWRTTNASCVNESTTGDAASNAADQLVAPEAVAGAGAADGARRR